MGVDIDIVALDLQWLSPGAVRRAYLTRLGMERLLGDASPRELVQQRETLGRLHDWYEALDVPPATNGVHFWDLSAYARNTICAHSPIRYYTGYTKRGSALLDGVLPRFLEDEAPEAHRLWMRLLGRPVDAEWFPFTDGGTTYRIDPGESRGGCLQNEKIVAFADALRPVLPKLQAFYEALDDRYRRSAAVTNHAVETLYGVCRNLDIRESTTQTLVAYTY